jgi:murein DD-endopeptidase MepM/ murein hydrolase activator NlpD
MMGLALTTGATPAFMQHRASASAPAGHLPALNDALNFPETEAGVTPAARHYTALATYRVQPGETLEMIAQRLELNIQDLAALNRLVASTPLLAGQALQVPRQSLQRSQLQALNRDPVAVHVEALTQDPPADEAASVPQDSKVPVLATLPPEPVPSLSASAAMTDQPSGLSPASNRSFEVASRSQEASLTPSESNWSRPDTYVVRPGDTLTLIANRFGLDPSQLSRENGISNPNLIFVGQQLRLPGSDRSEVPVLASVPPTETVASADLARLNLTLRDSATAPNSSGDRRQLALLTDLPVQDSPLSSPTRRNAVNYINQLQADIRAIGATQKAVPAPTASQADLVASAPIGSENYQPLLSAVLERSFSTNLTPPKFDNLLPNGGSVFQGYVWPSQGVLSSGFGWRWGRMHKGIDIAAPIGTPVVAAAAGVVTYAGWNDGGYGNLVEITHPDGSVTLYAHNHRVLVSLGQRVGQGQQVAEMGSTGRSTGPHLHFEIHPAGSGAVNPIAFLPGRNSRQG